MQPVAPDLTAHEWGTFTSIAGTQGQAIDWLPLTGSTDLPGFVEHFRNPGFKGGLRGTVRMETPVLYFYSSRDLTLSVRVAFSKGLITEWYPHASRIGAPENVTFSLYQGHTDGSIAWDSVTLEPGLAAEFPREARDNPYYAARETPAAPVRIQTPGGYQHEKFLFYRGVSASPLPVAAKLRAGGGLLVKNLSGQEIPNIILFERRGEKVGYRIGDALQDETTLDPPQLTGTVDSLCSDLEGMLIAQGLYSDEAHAMVGTWRHSWFEEGSRLLYIVPATFVDKILPLTINPTPAQTVRVFVGRLEIVTPATERAVQKAFASHDRATLKKYGRFLEPILRTMMEKRPAKAAQLQGYLNSLYNSELAQNILK